MLDSVSLPHLERGRPRPSVPTPSSLNNLPTKPSAPITIPLGRRRPVLHSTSNYAQPVSPPDTIFEMSPVTSEFAGHPRPSFSLAQTDRPADSFLYNFPSFSARPNQSISDQLHPSPSDRSTLSKRYRVADPLAIKCSPPPPKSNCVLDEYDLSAGSSFTHADEPLSMREKSNPRQQEGRRLERLSPGPRQPSYSSPWILPGRGEGAEDSEVAYSQMDPSNFEFQHHLLQRIESQNPSRIMNMRCNM